MSHSTCGATISNSTSTSGAEFQLTHPTRGATKILISRLSPSHGVRPLSRHTAADTHINFNSHTPHGVRLYDKALEEIDLGISTHTPHTGCDYSLQYDETDNTKFQLTHPTRGATWYRSPEQFASSSISTHTPHTGCDNTKMIL